MVGLPIMRIICFALQHLSRSLKEGGRAEPGGRAARNAGEASIWRWPIQADKRRRSLQPIAKVLQPDGGQRMRQAPTQVQNRRRGRCPTARIPVGEGPLVIGFCEFQMLI